jgi:1-deoxy-D-xylulose-5-phosphate synthase
MLFEAFNFEYFGPIKGHNIKHLVSILENIKHNPEPVLLHVTTVKGKGYSPAEKNPVYFHGVGSFEIETGARISNGASLPSYTEIFGDAMIKMADVDPKIVAVTAAMPEGTGLTRFSEKFPDRFFDVGIAEQHGVTFAAGMATEGLKPVVAIYSTFLQRAYDQVVHDVCIEALPVVFAIDRGGLVGEDGPTHHGMFDLAFLRSLPNMVVMAPKDENELCRMLKTALDHDGPIALRYPRGSGVGVKIDPQPLPLPVGKAELLAEGEDLYIFAIGRSVHEAMDARDRLLKEGISVGVVNCRFVKPLDSELLCRLAGSAKRVITVEENVIQGGFGSAVLECLQEGGITNCSIKRIGINDTFVPHGSQRQLRSDCQIDSAGIVKMAHRMMETPENSASTRNNPS